MIGTRQRRPRSSHLAVAALLAVCCSPQARADGFLDNIRSDVRSSGSGSGAEAVAPPEPQTEHKPTQRHRRHSYDPDDEMELGTAFGLVLVVGYATAATVTSPFWGPPAILGDSYDRDAYFADFPYEGRNEGTLTFFGNACDCGALHDESTGSLEHAAYCASLCGSSKTFSGRFTAEWAEQPGDVSRIGGRLQLSTSSRFGLDTQMDWLREPASGPVHDELWLGDCNVVFRFAQSERAQFYSGVGFNWLDDPVDTNYGFNFTYGADLFPVRPWVVSSSIDWGTLGRAEQFRFRLTGGLMVNRVEVFAGYEYLDIDRTQMNTYVGGVGIWF